MENPRLKIVPKLYTGESTVMSMRLPRDMLNTIDEVAKKTGRTRNELLTTCLEFALSHMEIDKDK